MSISSFFTSRQPRTAVRGAVRLACALVSGVALVAAPLALVHSPAAVADERSDAQQKKEAAQRKQQELISSLEGVSAELGQAYVALQAANEQLDSAQTALDAAEAVLAEKQREQQAATDRLTVAQAQLGKIQEQVSQSELQSQANRAAISSLVVATYQGDSALTSWTYVLASDSVDELTERASSMEVASGIQERVISAAEAERALAANQEAQQTAVTQRVNYFKEQADSAAAQAQQATDEAQAQRDNVATAQAQAASAASDLEAKKANLQAEQAQAQAAESEAQAEIARIDEENRQKAQAAGQSVAPAGSTASASSLGSGAIGHPIAGPLVVTSPYGYRVHPLLGYRKLHAGVDLMASTGTPQYAGVSGVVTSTRDYGNVLCGKSVTINGGIINGQSVQLIYCHLSQQQVVVGQTVTKGQQIGLTGATGGVTGPHCHFEVYINGRTVDPMSLPGF